MVRHKPTIIYVSKAYEFIWLVYAVTENITFEKHVTSVDISCSTMKKTTDAGEVVWEIQQDPMAAEDHIHCLLLGSPGPGGISMMFLPFGGGKPSDLTWF